MDGVNNLEDLWRVTLRNIEMPERHQFMRWQGMARMPVVEYALRRTGRKFRNALREGARMTSKDCERYCTSVIKHARCGHDRVGYVNGPRVGSEGVRRA
jgi:hypothetical protein